ncbi:MAG: nucleotide exchange factor GrpE [Actinomycetaceae bacterium]|nr:nucleotide exchange factor GrpE [Arcanobacterium sp.]MDD7505523.1 nucleotide exchange factor GrpE [Actinomycetaceae bacterium]
MADDDRKYFDDGQSGRADGSVSGEQSDRAARSNESHGSGADNHFEDAGPSRKTAGDAAENAAGEQDADQTPADRRTGVNPAPQDESHDEPQLEAESADAPSTSEDDESEGTLELSELDQALLKVAELEEQLARRNADMYNLQNEYNGYVKRSKAEALNQFALGSSKVIEALLGVLDNAHLAREHGELEGPAGKVVDELEQTLKVNFGLERYGAVGDPFDPTIHEALMHHTSADVENEQVAHLIQPGYKQGEKVLRPARVGVVSPE